MESTMTSVILHDHAREPGTGPPGGEPPGHSIKFQAPEMVFGSGSLAEAGFAARRPFVVTDDGLLAAGWVHELLGHLADADLAATVWAGVTSNPKDHEILAGFEHYRESGCDVLIAIGGGSCIDAAKGIAILTSNAGTSSTTPVWTR
jgi:alcohol dehydrogenase